MNRPKKVLILGGTRFCGQELARQLVTAGFSVTVLSRRRSGVVEGCTLIHGERSEILKAAGASFDFDVVYDFTAYDSKAVADALQVFTRARYFFISSLWLSKLADGAPISAQTREYLEKKQSCEDVVNSYRNTRPVATIRLPILMGEGDHTGRLDYYRQRLMDRKGVLIADGGQNEIECAWIGDIAVCLRKLLEFESVPQLLEARIGERMTLNQFLSVVAEVDKVPARLVSIPRKVFSKDPLADEYKVSAEGVDLFGFTETTPTQYRDWLSKIPFRPSPAAGSSEESRLVHSYGNGDSKYFPVLGMAENALRQIKLTPQSCKEEIPQIVQKLVAELALLTPELPILSIFDGGDRQVRPNDYWWINYQSEPKIDSAFSVERIQSEKVIFRACYPLRGCQASAR